MTMMSKLTSLKYIQNKQFKPKIYQGKRRGQMINFYDKHNYDQRNYLNRYRSDSRDRWILFIGRIQCGWDYIDGTGYEQKYRNDFRRHHFRRNMRTNQTYRGQNYRGGNRRNYQNEQIKRWVGVDLEKCSIQLILDGMTEVAVVDLVRIQTSKIETGSYVINVENMITLLKIVWHQN